MLNLIASDLYRITRPRGLRGSIWQYGIALLAAYALVVGLMMFARSQTYAELSGGNNVPIPSDFASYTAYMASMMSGIVPLCASFMAVENAQQDFKNGYVKSVLTARVGRLSYILGKVLFAGVVSALVVALAAVIVAVGTAAAGFYLRLDGQLGRACRMVRGLLAQRLGAFGSLARACVRYALRTGELSRSGFPLQRLRAPAAPLACAFFRWHPALFGARRTRAGDACRMDAHFGAVQS